MFGFFKKREEIFHRLMEQQASITHEGLELLVKYLETHDSALADRFDRTVELTDINQADEIGPRAPCAHSATRMAAVPGGGAGR